MCERISACTPAHARLTRYCLPPAPPSRPPGDMISNLTMGGRVPLEYYYVDDSNKGQG